MSDSKSSPGEEKQQSSTLATISNESHFTSSIKKKILLIDAQTSLPVGIYLEKDNTLSLRNVQLIYPNATTVKCVFPGEAESDIFPCENERIISPINIWPDVIFEPVMPSYAVPPLINLIQTHSRGYAPCQLTNLFNPNLCLDAELLIDCGCSIDLILPSKEIKKLQLKEKTGGIAAKGFNNHITILPQYEDVKITVTLKHAITKHSTTKTAIISVFERLPIFTSDVGTQCSNDIASDETEPTTPHLWSPQRNNGMTTSTMSINDNQESNLLILKLSPLKYPLKDGDQYGILGYPAMTKLNLGVHFGGNYIFAVERLFEYIS